MQFLELQRCTFPPAALLELAPLSRLTHLFVEDCDESIGSPSGMVALTELCCRLDAVKRVDLSVRDVEGLRPGWFSWVGAVIQVEEGLQARGKLVAFGVAECLD